MDNAAQVHCTAAPQYRYTTVQVRHCTGTTTLEVPPLYTFVSIPLFAGCGGLTNALRLEGVIVGEGTDWKSVAYGLYWNLKDKLMQRRYLKRTREVLRPTGTHYALPGTKWCAAGIVRRRGV